MLESEFFRLVPKDAIVWLDFEGVLTEKNIFFYLLKYKPMFSVKSLLNGFVKTSENKFRNNGEISRKDFIEFFKKNYEKLSICELYDLGDKIFFFQSKDHKKALCDLLSVLKKDFYDVYIITSAKREIVKGFLNNIPKEININEKNVYATGSRYIDGFEKGLIVDYLKNKTKKKIIGVGDTEEDEMALTRSDIACMISSLPYKLMPCNVVNGYKFENLFKLKSFFDKIKKSVNFTITPEMKF